MASLTFASAERCPARAARNGCTRWRWFLFGLSLIPVILLLLLWIGLSWLNGEYV